MKLQTRAWISFLTTLVLLESILSITDENGIIKLIALILLVLNSMLLGGQLDRLFKIVQE